MILCCYCWPNPARNYWRENWNLQIFSGFLETVDLKEKITFLAQRNSEKLGRIVLSLTWYGCEPAITILNQPKSIRFSYRTITVIIMASCWGRITAETSSVNVPARNICCCFYPVMQVVYIYSSLFSQGFFFFFPVVLRPNAGHGLLILEVSWSRTTTHHSR